MQNGGSKRTFRWWCGGNAQVRLALRNPACPPITPHPHDALSVGSPVELFFSPICAFGKTRWDIPGRTCACQGQPIFDSGHSSHDCPYVLQTSALNFLMGIIQFPGLSVPLQLDCSCHGQFCSFRNYVRPGEPHRFNRQHDAFLFQDFRPSNYTWTTWLLMSDKQRENSPVHMVPIFRGHWQWEILKV